MGGLAYLQKIGIESYANQLTIQIAKSKNLPIPAHGFNDSLLFKLGNKNIDCYYLGAAHTKDNIVVWIPSEKILFCGCMIKEMDAKNPGNMADGDLNEYPKTLEKVLTKFQQAKIVIPGHGAFGGIELIKHTQDLLKRLYRIALIKNRFGNNRLKMKIEHIGICVSKPIQMAAWYKEHLGCKIKYTSGDE